MKDIRRFRKLKIAHVKRRDFLTAHQTKGSKVNITQKSPVKTSFASFADSKDDLFSQIAATGTGQLRLDRSHGREWVWLWRWRILSRWSQKEKAKGSYANKCFTLKPPRVTKLYAVIEQKRPRIGTAWKRPSRTGHCSWQKKGRRPFDRNSRKARQP